jgi:two-component system, chemotaxis family, sensor kinase CheA
MNESPAESKNELLDSLLSDFLDESDQHLTQLNANLLQLDEWVQALGDNHGQRCDENLVNEMFRAAHSLKGLSAMLGLTEINNLTHKIENVFDAARHGQLTVTRDITELMFMGLDQLSALVALLKEPDGPPVDCDAVLASIQRVLQTAGVEKKKATQADAERAMNCAAQEVAAEPLAPDGRPGAPPQADLFGGIEDENNIPENYLSMFIDEAEQSLDVLSSGLLALEGGEHGVELKNLLGTAHKIKGSAASLGLNRAAKLAHLMEDLFENHVAQDAGLSPPAVDVLLKSSDGLRQYVANLKSGGSQPDQFEQLAQGLVAVRSGGRPAGTAMSTYAGEILLQPDLHLAGLKAQLIYEKLAKLGEVRDCRPPLAELEQIDHLDRFCFQLTTDQSRETVLRQVNVGGVLEVRLEAVAAPPAAEARPQAGPTSPEPLRTPSEAAPRTAPAAPRPVETVRVDTDRLDQLMDLAGQLVINKAQFTQIGDRLKTVADCNHAVHAIEKLSTELGQLGSGAGLRHDDQHSVGGLESVRNQIRRLRNDLEPIRREVHILSRARDSVRGLFEAIHQLDRISDGIQKGVMDIRMVPIGPLFARFQRVVRDISRSGGKQIRLEIIGEKTELDKRMIDELGDPLVHLVRNSADHGIETPEQREAAGKCRQGTVTLDAFHRGNSIVIEVRDDGKGLDPERILRKAVEKGLVSEADAPRMTPAQIYPLIWKPGLSTAEKVTDVSGRGMGMDIVKTKIEELSGTVEIASRPGQGTTITLKLPLTLAILPSLMVDIGGDVFAMPMETVTGIVGLAGNKIYTLQGCPVATVRGRVVPLIRLGDALNFHRTVGRTEADAASESSLVIVRSEEQEIGLAVDRVIGEEDVVIKSIAENYKNVAGIAGASILGDGRVALILDIPALMASLSRRTASATR